jgi:protein TonB
MTLPKGTLVESALEPPTARRGVPAWIWAVMCLAAIAGAYVFISRGGALQIDTTPRPAETTETASNAPVETPPEAVANTPSDAAGAKVAAPAPTPKSAKLVPEAKQPLPSDAKPVVAKKSPEAGPAAAQAVAAPKPKIGSKAIAEWKAGQPAVPAPLDSDASVAGVEALPGVAVASPATVPTIVAGTLVPLDEADVSPVNLQHKAPIYSLQARQMRLAGSVAMNVLVNEFGTVDQVVLVSGVPGADLNESAIRAAQGWTYRPATKQGVPVKVWKPEQVVFKP